MNTYCAIYVNRSTIKECVVKADTSFAAQQEAAREMHIPDALRYKVSVYLAEQDSAPVVHVADC